MIGTPFPVGAGPRRFFDITVSCFGIETLISEFQPWRKRGDSPSSDPHLPTDTKALHHLMVAMATTTAGRSYHRYKGGVPVIRVDRRDVGNR